MRILLIVVLLLILFGGGLGWHSGYWTSGGYGPGMFGGLGFLVFIIVLLALFGGL